jgi:tetratricopeptide (TPR) repeat protein/transcriptional regulator with XRE-family HTH domain
MAQNIKLKDARLKRFFSLVEAGNLIGVHRNTLRSWEAGIRQPHISSIKLLCEAYKATPEEVGLEQLLHLKGGQEATQGESANPLVTEHRIFSKSGPLASTAPEHGISENGFSHHEGSQGGILVFEELEVRLLTPVMQWKQDNKLYEPLQAMVVREMEKDIAMTQEPHDNSIESPERRKALRFLATLPISVYGLTFTGSTRPTPEKEVLPYCAAGLTACWYLSKGSDLPRVQSIVSSYLPTLTTFVKHSPDYREAAAGLASQGYMLLGLMTMHLKNLAAAEAYYREAVKYSKIAKDDNLEITAQGWLCDIFRYGKNPLKGIKVYQEKLPYLQQASPLVRTHTYGHLAEFYAQSGQKQEALTALGRAHEAFSLVPGDDGNFIYALYDRASLISNEGLTRYELGRLESDKKARNAQYEKALACFQQVETLQTGGDISERMRLEFWNNRALAALRLNDMEQSIASLTVAVPGAIALGSERRYAEAEEIYRVMDVMWDGEPRLRELRDLFERKRAGME